MAKAVWSGSLSFGLVNIPVRLYNATSPKDVRFHQFERGSNRRIRYRRVTEPPAFETPVETTTRGPDVDRQRPEPEPPSSSSPAGGLRGPGEVAFDDVVKGYEIEPDRYVMVSPDELRTLEPEPTRTIEIEGFVDLSEIDPVSFEKSYYVAPQRGAGAERPYALLLEALRRTRRAGIARFVMRTREYLAAIRPMEGIIGLETLFYADEIRASTEIDNVPGPTEVPERELAMAVQFVDLLEMAWDPSRYRDSYRERVLDLLRRRSEEEGTLEPEPAQEPTGPVAVPDLMAALRASVEAARERGAGTERPKRRRRTG